jgi:sortase (surface protein transpeptidase)
LDVQTVTQSLRPLFDPALNLRAGPVDVRLELQIPSLQISAPVLGVGITSKNAMDAPGGEAHDAVWQQVFWYRGSAIPGDSGTATIAGHITGRYGEAAIFSRLDVLAPGDVIVVHDSRADQDIRFSVTETATYSAQQATDPSVLTRIYGAGPVSGRGPQPAPDGHSYLTLITCAGDFVNGSFDHRLVVYAKRSD